MGNRVTETFIQKNTGEMFSYAELTVSDFELSVYWKHVSAAQLWGHLPNTE